MDFKDYYKILGVARTAPAAEIKKKYRDLAKKYHPDANPGSRQAESRFKEISEAYEVIGDEAKRRKYDELLKYGYDPSSGGFKRRGAGSAVPPGGFEDLFRGMGVPGGGGDDFTDLFDRLFGRSVRPEPPPRRQGGRRAPADFSPHAGDAHTKVAVTYVEAILGTRKKVATPAGDVMLKIPAGVQPGTKLKLKGQGLNRGGAAGDLFVEVEVRIPRRVPAGAAEKLAAIDRESSY